MTIEDQNPRPVGLVVDDKAQDQRGLVATAIDLNEMIGQVVDGVTQDLGGVIVMATGLDAVTGQIVGDGIHGQRRVRTPITALSAGGAASKAGEHQITIIHVMEQWGGRTAYLLRSILITYIK